MSHGEGGIPRNDETIAVEWPKLDVPYKTSKKDEKHAPSLLRTSPGPPNFDTRGRGWSVIFENET